MSSMWLIRSKRDLEVVGIRVVTTCERLENDSGHQIRCRAGEVINAGHADTVGQ
jgi:hypothetical protein